MSSILRPLGLRTDCACAVLGGVPPRHASIGFVGVRGPTYTRIRVVTNQVEQVVLDDRENERGKELPDPHAPDLCLQDGCWVAKSWKTRPTLPVTGVRRPSACPGPRW